MKKDSIVQFVCFATNLSLDVFIPKWEEFVKKMMDKKQEPALQQLVTETKNKFRYISQHEWPEKDFHFTFMNERKSDNFPEQNVKVVQVGGYIPLQIKKRQAKEDGDVKLIAFVSHNEVDIDFYQQLPLYHLLNIYQAFYESCAYGYVMEFFISEKNADELLIELKQRPGVDAAIYKDCLVTQE